VIRLILGWIQLWDRLRLRRLAKLHPGLEISPLASTNLACAIYDLAPGARLKIGPGVTTERRAGQLRFDIGAGASVEVGGGTWLRTDLDRIHLIAYPGASIAIGEESFLSGCMVSAKREVEIGPGLLMGAGSRIYDADQHPLDDSTPERIDRVQIGRDVWLASDVTILRGVEIGESCIVATRSVVTHSIPPQTIVAGVPARKIGSLGDRRRVRLA
jgi:acetyltransferase-like isoleucine patch superfamily enzyme